MGFSSIGQDDILFVLQSATTVKRKEKLTKIEEEKNHETLSVMKRATFQLHGY